MMRLFLFVLLSLLARPGLAGEGLMNRLLSPGPLITGHQDLEKIDCLKCHELNKGVPDSKCLDCHKEIRKSVEAKHGFHGLAGEACIKCHSDHKGRSYDSTKVDPKTFNHNRTGYVLEGKHADLRCHECHTERRTKMATRKNDLHFLGMAASTCISCHKKDDPHKFTGKAAEKDCASCHGMSSWKTQIRFDHDRDTSYKLEGGHKSLKCTDCHKEKTGERYRYQFPEMKERQCLSCHRDQHQNKFGPKFQGGDCLKCHSAALDTWKIAKFDHGVTEYPLKGKHAQIKCIACHKQASPKTEIKDFQFKGLKKDCLGCHKNFHQFSAEPGRKLGNLLNCTLCHTEVSWKSNFNHNTDTRYEISGKHIGLKCEQCHTADPARPGFRVYKWPHFTEKTCETCHKSPHLNSFSKENLAKRCTECHVDTGWNKTRSSKFNHDTSTRFALEGRHKEISCASCHAGEDKKQVFRFPSFEKKFCVDCHANPHNGQFSSRIAQNECASCHDSESFTRRLPFDHKTTRFELTDKHAELKCEECHKPTGEKFAMKPYHPKGRFQFDHVGQAFCVDCHENVHKGQFHPSATQDECLRCHVTASFGKRLPFRHNETNFPLRGRHAEVRCDKCHVGTENVFPKTNHRMRKFVFGATPGACVGCHKDPHRGGYGSRCNECHSETTWARTADFHKSFTLTGVHFSLSCAECHKDNRRLAGLSQNCNICHQKDDVHGGTLSKCGDCHRQTFWENQKFNHGLTRFALRGVHRTLECYSCHSTGVYKGLPSRCADCHQQRALSFTGSPNHALLIGRSCAECHNQFSFH